MERRIKKGQSSWVGGRDGAEEHLRSRVLNGERTDYIDLEAQKQRVADLVSM